MAQTRSRFSASDSPQSAASYVRRSAAAMRARSQKLDIRQSERAAVIEWAYRSPVRRVSFSYIEQFERVSEGAEHVVYYDANFGLAVKATHVNRFGHSVRGEGAQATLLEYLRRLAWQNVLFGDDIRVAGVAFDEAQIEIVTTQPWITADKASPAATHSEIVEYFNRLSFLHVPLAEESPLFYCDAIRVLVADAHEGNVLRAETGQLMPIDVVIGVPEEPFLSQIKAACKAGPKFDRQDQILP